MQRQHHEGSHAAAVQRHHGQLPTASTHPQRYEPYHIPAHKCWCGKHHRPYDWPHCRQCTRQHLGPWARRCSLCQNLSHWGAPCGAQPPKTQQHAEKKQPLVLQMPASLEQGKRKMILETTQKVLDAALKDPGIASREVFPGIVYGLGRVGEELEREMRVLREGAHFVHRG